MSLANFSRASLPFLNVYMTASDIISPLSLLILPLGAFANIVNIIIFIKSGSKDNITVSLLALSAADLAFLVIISPHVVFLSVAHLVQERLGIEFDWLIDITILWVPFYWYAFVAYDTATLITVYISVVRCACVALPFKVKDVFTARRAVITFCVFFLCVFLLRLPSLIRTRLVREVDESTNTTKYVHKEFDDGGVADTINDIVNRNLVPWTCFTIVLGCLVVMLTKLRASARFRQSSTAQDSQNKSSDTGDEITTTRGHKTQTLSPRDLKVLRSIILVASIFITCQTPFMCYSLARRLESGFDDETETGRVSRFINLFSVASRLSTFCALLNATVNILVYFNYNSRYRECFHLLFNTDKLCKKLEK